jgi:HlyD family secretion protein
VARRSSLRGTIAISGLVLIVTGLAMYALLPSPMLVETSRVTRGPMQVTVDQEGETRVHDRFVMSSPVVGRLLRVDLYDGDPVRVGQVVARIDPAPLSQREREEIEARVQAAEAALRQAKARESHARADREQAGRDRQRAESLAKAGVISDQSVEQARNADTTAADEVDAASFAVQEAASEEKVARAGLIGLDGDPTKPRPLIELRSPVSGRVLRVLEKSERVVSVGTPIMNLGQPSEIEIVTDVLSTDAVRIPPRAEAIVDGWGGDHPLRARVRLVEPYGFTKVSALGVEEQRVNVISDFLDSPGPLGDGYRVQTHIVTWSSPGVLKAPLSALFRRGSGWSVFAIDAGRAKTIEVEIGHRNELEVEILKGLTEGEEVILHPSNQLADGMKVRTE